MPVTGIINFAGLDEYLAALQQINVDIDEAARAAVAEAAPLAETEIARMAMEHLLTGATADSIYMTPVQSEGSFHFVEVGARTDGESAALYDEFGTVWMEPRPFFRKGINNIRHRWRNSIKATLKSKMGVDFG